MAEKEMEMETLFKVRVGVDRAKGLAKADLFGKSDPYCIITLLDRSTGKKETRRTKTLKKTLDPVWDEVQYVFDTHIYTVRACVRACLIYALCVDCRFSSLH